MFYLPTLDINLAPEDGDMLWTFSSAAAIVS